MGHRTATRVAYYGEHRAARAGHRHRPRADGSEPGEERLMPAGADLPSALEWMDSGWQGALSSRGFDSHKTQWTCGFGASARGRPTALILYFTQAGWRRDAALGLPPDGRWLCIITRTSSGRGWRAYVQVVPDAGGKVRVSTSGGAQMAWRKDGRELFYMALDGRLMAVPMQPAPDGTLRPAAPPSRYS